MSTIRATFNCRPETELDRYVYTYVITDVYTRSLGQNEGRGGVTVTQNHYLVAISRTSSGPFRDFKQKQKRGTRRKAKRKRFEAMRQNDVDGLCLALPSIYAGPSHFHASLVLHFDSAPTRPLGAVGPHPPVRPPDEASPTLLTFHWNTQQSSPPTLTCGFTHRRTDELPAISTLQTRRNTTRAKLDS